MVVWAGRLGGCYRTSSPKKIFFNILSSGIPHLFPPFLRGFVNLQSNWTKRYIRPITEKVAHYLTNPLVSVHQEFLSPCKCKALHCAMRAVNTRET